MKKVIIALLAAGIATFGLSGLVFAFHDGGVADCAGCHTMHNSQDGAIVDANGSIGSAAGDYLLKGATPSDACLTCHAGSGGYHMLSGDGSAHTPGGDFYWVTTGTDFTWTAHGNTYNSMSWEHGHNVYSLENSIDEDPVLTTAPGGTFPAGQVLGCNSCHDPHGKIRENSNPGIISDSGSYGAADPTDGTILGNYRLLGGYGYDGGDNARTPWASSFGYNAPIAAAPGFENYASAFQEVYQVQHAAYGQGMSEWCANCHTGFLNAGAVNADGAETNHRHPAGDGAELPADLLANYNAYIKTGDMSGDGTAAYLMFVPFEQGISDREALGAARTTFGGPVSGANVMCLSCHRSHGSAFADMGRWDFTTEFLADSHPDGGTTDDSIASDKTNSYYGVDIALEFGQYQRSFCNKCHAQD